MNQPAATDDRRAIRNVVVLFFAQGILGSQMPVSVILGGLAGAALAERQSLATLPVSIVVLCSMLTAPCASLLMGRVGRRAGFLLAAGFGAAGGLLAARALFVSSFPMLLAGAAFTGMYNGFQGFFRFAATDSASDTFKPKAIGWVMAGGLVSAVVGPEIVRHTSDAFAATPFAGAYLALIAVNLLGAMVVLFLDIPVPPRQARVAPSGRPLGEIFSQPRVIVAVLCAMVSYGLMSLVMTSTSLAMVGHGFTTNHAADVVRWHVVAMFAPSFITGSLIARFGHRSVMAAGLALLGGCGAIAAAGVGLQNFYLALIALGVGWNFGFVGATSLLATCHSGEEQAKVQGLNDFLVLGLVATASFGSGALLNSYGWTTVQFAMIPALAVAALALAWLALRGRAEAATGGFSG